MPQKEFRKVMSVHSAIEAVFNATTSAFGFKHWTDWKRTTRGRWAGNKRKATAARIAAIRTLKQMGYTYKAIAQITGWTYRMVRRWAEDKAGAHYYHIVERARLELSLKQLKQAA